MINAKTLQKALQFCKPAMSKEETRHYLCGVHFHKKTDGQLKLVATDGHRMHISTVAEHQLPEGLEFNFTLPATAVRNLINLLKAAKNDEALYLWSKENNIKVVMDDLDIDFKMLGGKYPDFNAVIPAGELTEASLSENAELSVPYLSDLLKAFKLAGEESVKFLREANPEFTSPIVTKSENGFALLMPRHGAGNEIDSPEPTPLEQHIDEQIAQEQQAA